MAESDRIERLQEALRLASAYSALDPDLRAKMADLTGLSSEEIPDLDQAHRSVIDGIEILADAVRQHAGATDGYAVVLEAAQEGVEWELQLQTVAQAINVVNAATVGRVIQREILEVAEIEIEHSHVTIQKMLDGLADAQRVSGSTFTAVSATVVSAVNTKFTPILAKQLKYPPRPTKSETIRRNKLEGERKPKHGRVSIPPNPRNRSSR